jgi:hypothetical protein
MVMHKTKNGNIIQAMRWGNTHSRMCNQNIPQLHQGDSFVLKPLFTTKASQSPFLCSWKSCSFGTKNVNELLDWVCIQKKKNNITFPNYTTFCPKSFAQKCDIILYIVTKWKHFHNKSFYLWNIYLFFWKVSWNGP